jgi:hypothetical protein
MPMPNIMYYIADVVHNLKRVVPQINLHRVVPQTFLHTVQENCDEEQLKQVGQWCYKNSSLIISVTISISRPRIMWRS